jgi:hypothetical protein
LVPSLAFSLIPLPASSWLYHRGNSDGNTVFGNVRNYNRVGPNHCVVTNDNSTQYLRASADPDTSSEARQSRFGPSADRNLLKQPTIRPNLGLVMNYYAVWMGQLETSTDGKCVQGYVRASDNGPKPVSNNSGLA